MARQIARRSAARDAGDGQQDAGLGPVLVSKVAVGGSNWKYWRLYLLIALLACGLFALLSFGNVLEHAAQATGRYTSWRVEDLFALLTAATFALIAVLTVHERQLQAAIGQRKRAEIQARTASRYDALTGIANRAVFQEEFARAVGAAQATHARLALMVIDIDAFHSVNETLGHRGGDRVLSTVALLLRTLMRKDDILARLGGDEFVVLSPVTADDSGDLFRLAERMLKLVREGVDAQGMPTGVSVSIGIAKFPRDGDSETVLLRCAETALAQAKAVGRDRYALYDSTLDARRRARLDTEAELREGLEHDQIVALYQPLVDLKTGHPVGFEALARWNHPQRGLLGAPEFIPIAEDAGLVGRLLTAMLRRVCEDTRHWPDGVSIAVNLSPPQLLDPALPDEILSILAQTGVPPRRIEIEITETALLQDFETARRTMSALRAAGIRMSLDDFGTGFSSLRHLQELPIDKIKIDSSFTRRLIGDPQCQKIVASMLGLATALELVTVAEGVETAQQADWLRAHGCTLGQGYLFARPVPAAEALATLPRHEA
ncbi:EAL domain-containing protein [Xanthobacter sp. V4C-4]|uniref:putative bifunctional diguanylate cyclase/phosphodiesterase n=1 Tax=Xanthobacter cornucopiae TaxID=3119924 RepID=UPI003729E03E